MASAKLASLVAKKEGKRSQSSIGNVRETLKAFETVLAEESFKANDRDLVDSVHLDSVVLSAQKKLNQLWRKFDSAKK